MIRCLDCGQEYAPYRYSGIMISLCRGCREDPSPRKPDTLKCVNGLWRDVVDQDEQDAYQIKYDAWRKRRGLSDDAT